MNKLNHYSQSGHCFPELVEKEQSRIISQVKATIWKTDFTRINNNFLSTLKEPLKDGIKILFLARITFDATHGLSINILDIDPSYTLGDLEREKQETIDRLRLENIFDRNKRIKLPLLPQRIAIISVETSKGYADFKKVIEGNPWQYRFFHYLFPSLLQGEKAVDSIIGQLRRIRKISSHFDVVAIIRGGGGDIGLSCYNNYSLAKEIALFPLPVITGIGHATNETVTEMISHSNAITPTKLAEFLIQKFHDFAYPVLEGERKIIDKAKRLLSEENVHFAGTVRMFRSSTKNILSANKIELRNMSSVVSSESMFIMKSEKRSLEGISSTLEKEVRSRVSQSEGALTTTSHTIGRNAQFILQSEKQAIVQLSKILPAGINNLFKHNIAEINGIEKNVFNLSPQNVLKRGFSITLINGKAVKSSNELKAGDSINTILYNGELISKVQSKKKAE
jgi:exodeoxyribonuclease VII large subunit